MKIEDEERQCWQVTLKCVFGGLGERELGPSSCQDAAQSNGARHSVHFANTVVDAVWPSIPKLVCHVENL